MTRYLICQKCRSKEPRGESEPYPGEHKVVVFGAALHPDPEQRKIVIREIGDNLNEIKSKTVTPLSPGNYDCDYCSAPIMPGEPCAAVSIWVGSREVIDWVDWSDDFLRREP